MKSICPRSGDVLPRGRGRNIPADSVVAPSLPSQPRGSTVPGCCGVVNLFTGWTWMNGNYFKRTVALAGFGLLASACAGAQTVRVPVDPAPVVQAGAPGEEGRTITAGQVAQIGSPRHVAADAEFMRDMIIHHAQAVEMTALVAERTTSQDIRLLAERIEASQGRRDADDAALADGPR
jgi:hypothetical protein